MSPGHSRWEVMGDLPPEVSGPTLPNQVQVWETEGWLKSGLAAGSGLPGGVGWEAAASR